MPLIGVISASFPIVCKCNSESFAVSATAGSNVIDYGEYSITRRIEELVHHTSDCKVFRTASFSTLQANKPAVIADKAGKYPPVTAEQFVRDSLKAIYVANAWFSMLKEVVESYASLNRNMRLALHLDAVHIATCINRICPWLNQHLTIIILQTCQ